MTQHTKDRELLELAAKAIGRSAKTWLPDNGQYAPWNIMAGLNVSDGRVTLWNPLEEDGDALRLAVRLGILFLIDVQCGKVVKKTVVTDGKTKHEVKHDGDPYAATRRAIVLAAAEIGKAGGAV